VADLTAPRPRSFRDLRAWQEAMRAAEMVHACTARWPESEGAGLTRQTRRAAVSVPANIAEGHGRGATNEFRYHLRVAAGSLSELQTHLELARRFGYLSENEHMALETQFNHVARLIGAFIRSLKES
jgi:four helix bundle protein